MRNSSLALLSFAVAASLSGNVFAQNDDCAGAIAVLAGTTTGSTVGATTSTPAWTCAAGGSDLWYSWVATGSGNCQIDLCGSGYDTALAVYDGTCGALNQLGCNDDYCGLQSGLNIPITGGTTYYIRVGGFASNTGSFSLNITPQIGVASSLSSYGTGCVTRAGGSFYELFTPASSFDLNGTSMTLLRTSPGYVALPSIGTYVAPTGAAVALALGDDSSIATPALSSPFPYDGGSAATLTVCSNGSVWAAGGNSVGYDPNVAGMISNPSAGWYTWHDFNPSATGSGAVKFEEVGGVAYITWDGVISYGTSNVSTMQMQFDESTGSVTYVWQSMDLAGSSLGGGGYLVGYAPGSSIDPGATDISVALTTGLTVTRDIHPLVLTASANPIIGNTISLDTSGITTTAPFGAVLLGLTNPGLDLTGIGMPSCFQYTDSLATLLFLPSGNTSVSTSWNVPAAAGIHVLAQAVSYDPIAALTPLGAVSSNGIDLGIGDY